MSGRFQVQEWREKLYSLMDAVHAADDAAYAAMGTDDEAAALTALRVAKTEFRAAEKQHVGQSYADACSRCGGAGGSDAWRMTGWTCYDCGGHGTQYRTWTKVRFRGDVRKRWEADQAREAENRERDRAFAEAVCEMGDAGVALVEAAAATWAADRAVDAGYYGDDMAVDRETRFRSDLAWKLHRYGSLTEAQMAALERGLERDREEAAKQARAKAAGRFDGGKVDVVGTVLHTKWQENRFGAGSTKKMLVELDDGRRVWGTVAASLDEVEYGDDGEYLGSRLLGKGDRVAFTAAVDASRDDETFGFFKRPTKARVLARAESEEG